MESPQQNSVWNMVKCSANVNHIPSEFTKVQKEKRTKQVASQNHVPSPDRYPLSFSARAIAGC